MLLSPLKLIAREEITRGWSGDRTKILDPMLRQLMVYHGVINKFPKGFCINIIFSHRKSHYELFRMFRMFRMVQNDFRTGLALAKSALRVLPRLFPTNMAMLDPFLTSV